MMKHPYNPICECHDCHVVRRVAPLHVTETDQRINRIYMRLDWLEKGQGIDVRAFAADVRALLADVVSKRTLT